MSVFQGLKIYPESGLNFAWQEVMTDGTHSSFDASLGPDGVVMAFVMRVYWADITTAIQRLLGYSWRDPSWSNSVTGTTVRLRRNLPWQHPYNNQLWVKNISSVKGEILQGVNEQPITFGEGGVGNGYPTNFGPWSQYKFAVLVLHFWRPPYFIRTDDDILDENGDPQEWLRYVDKQWEINTQMLTREGTTFTYSPGQGTGTGNPTSGSAFQGSVGQPITRMKVVRKWYQIPEQCIFQPGQDATPNGLPFNLVFMQRSATNPITGYTQTTDPDLGITFPITTCVNVPIGGGTIQGTAPFVLDDDPSKRLFGCFMGTLKYEGVRIIPRDLQMPPGLMQIPLFVGSEPVSQVQYDVEMHFEYFDPPRGPDVPNEFAGHNCVPWSGNGLWYACQSQLPVGAGGVPTTPIQYADLSDLFFVQ